MVRRTEVSLGDAIGDTFACDSPLFVKLYTDRLEAAAQVSFMQSVFEATSDQSVVRVPEVYDCRAVDEGVVVTMERLGGTALGEATYRYGEHTTPDGSILHLAEARREVRTTIASAIGPVAARLALNDIGQRGHFDNIRVEKRDESWRYGVIDQPVVVTPFDRMRAKLLLQALGRSPATLGI